MSLYFLSANDFNIQKTEKGPVLGINLPGHSIVLFYSDNCVHCHKYLPVFKKLPTMIANCNVCLVHVGKEKNVVNMAKNTIAPLKYVPFIVFYFNTVPIQEYTGEANEKLISNFIIDMATAMTKRQQSIQKKPEEKGGDSLPPYSIGRPISGDKRSEVCYLSNQEAYKPKPTQ